MEAEGMTDIFQAKEMASSRNAIYASEMTYSKN